jgi:3-hydroxyisobutyrate dehydrogenase
MTNLSRAIAVVGLGAMGGPMSRRLISAGLEVRGFDRDADAMARFSHAGGVPAASAAEAAQGAAALLLLVVNDAQADDVLFGAGNAARALAPAAVVILSLTTAPDTAAGIGERLERLGLRMIDCPVSGGVKRAESGTLNLIAAGPAESIDAARPYLAPLGTIRVVGDRYGQASSVKLVNQLLCGIHMAAAAEAVALAERAGINPHLLYEVINASSGSSGIFVDRVPMMLGPSERTTAAIDILVKDLSLAVALGTALHARLPMTQNALGLFAEASCKGMGAYNDSEIIKLLREDERD